MVLQSSGTIYFNDISKEFLGVSNLQNNLSNYYTNAPSNYTTGVVGLPSIGTTLYASTFYGKSCKIGAKLFTTVGNNSWTIPNGVNMISAVCIGGGGGARVVVATTGSRSIGGGGGGALAYINNVRVTPGTSFTITVGGGGNQANGGDSYITNNIQNIIVRAGGGKLGAYISSAGSNSALGGAGGTVLIGSGGNGGNGGSVVNGFTGYANYGEGGGAGGYTGNGGNGGNRDGGGRTAGSGGGGGGGWGAQAIYTNSTVGAASLGGGTCLYGQGINGAASTGLNINGSPGSTDTGGTGLIAYGNGSGGRASGTSKGGDGAVIIVYGTSCYYPSTNVNLPFVGV
jgi:hypothetical protein